MARASVHSVAAQAGSMIAAARFSAAVPGEARSPSGFCPTSAGLFFTKNVSGAIPNSTSHPIATQEARQPSVRMMVWSQGKRMTAPTPAPAKAMLIASARRRTNQCGRNCECTV